MFPHWTWELNMRGRDQDVIISTANTATVTQCWLAAHCIHTTLRDNGANGEPDPTENISTSQCRGDGGKTGHARICRMRLMSNYNGLNLSFELSLNNFIENFISLNYRWIISFKIGNILYLLYYHGMIGIINPMVSSKACVQSYIQCMQYYLS